MKKILCLLSISLFLCQIGLSQDKKRFGRMERVKDSLFVVENGKRHIVDKTTIIVKPKSGIDKIGNELKILRYNKLGYMLLSVPKDIEIENFVTLLEKKGVFDIVEYNNMGKYSFVPNDTRINEQWYLNSINVFSAWDVTMGSSNVIVAVLDSGVEYTHYDIGYGMTGYRNIIDTLGVDYISPIFPNATISNEHGTQIAGIIGAKTHNSLGIAGITGGKFYAGVKMISYRVGDYFSPYAEAVANAIYDAVDKGAKVINMSFSLGQTHVVNDAIEYAIQNNVLIVAAAGNTCSGAIYDPCVVDYPASHNDVIAVGAIKQNNYRWYRSNYGTNLDVVAPGVDILTTTINNYYDVVHGTSFSTAIVSGIAALILSVRPDLTQKQLRHAIESTCNPLGNYPASYHTRPYEYWNHEVGYGLVDAHNAINTALQLCSTNLTNQVIARDTTIIGCNRLNVKNVTVTNTAKLTILSDGDVTFDDSFIVEAGAEFEIIKN